MSYDGKNTPGIYPADKSKLSGSRSIPAARVRAAWTFSNKTQIPAEAPATVCEICAGPFSLPWLSWSTLQNHIFIRCDYTHPRMHRAALTRRQHTESVVSHKAIDKIGARQAGLISGQNDGAGGRQDTPEAVDQGYLTVGHLSCAALIPQLAHRFHQ